jgi:hypothetical protein
MSQYGRSCRTWWAERSQRSVKLQIEYLEHLLNEPPTFQECLVSALKKLFVGLYLLSAEVVGVPFGLAMRTERFANFDEFFTRLPFAQIVFAVVFFGLLGMPAYVFANALMDLQKLRYGRKEKIWRVRTEKRIENLKAKLGQAQPI